MGVVLPTPLTPMTRMTAGVVRKSMVSSFPSMSDTTCLMTARTSAGFEMPWALTRAFVSSTICSEVMTPTSDMTSTSTSSS